MGAWEYEVKTSGIDPGDIQNELDSAARNEWELVSVIVVEATRNEWRTRLIFKRPSADGQAQDD
jgi:hypothetical protein